MPKTADVPKQAATTVEVGPETAAMVTIYNALKAIPEDWEDPHTTHAALIGINNL